MIFSAERLHKHTHTQTQSHFCLRAQEARCIGSALNAMYSLPSLRHNCIATVTKKPHSNKEDGQGMLTVSRTTQGMLTVSRTVHVQECQQDSTRNVDSRTAQGMLTVGQHKEC
ncbi:hypothetical protein BaRGS_00008105 [Batillaria attramentaria]|uniref:Uncharacterized protein n=1 Tax=Batillaria attramentaria TaxID=370345 RepID=A0ABD0LM61_9CAEN